VKFEQSRSIGWEVQVGRTGERSGAYRVTVGKPEGKRTLGRCRRRWKGNIKMNL
jgi:hypothetical protein